MRIWEGHPPRRYQVHAMVRFNDPYHCPSFVRAGTNTNRLMKDWIDLIFVGMATTTWLALSVVFVELWYLDEVKVTEDILWVRSLELGMFSMLTCWGLIKFWRKGDRL